MKLISTLLSAGVFCVVVALPASAQMGHVLNGVGPYDQSFSGAGMAAVGDGLSALHWNPAAISALPGNEFDISLQLMFPTTELSSGVTPQGATDQMSGKTSSDAGPFPIPALGIVYRPEGSRSTFGLSALGVGGFGVDYAENMTNPISAPQSAGGFGHIKSSFSLFQIAPTYAYSVAPGVSVGVSPTLNIGMLEVRPFPATSPTQTGYPDGPRTTSLGFGGQAGIHFISASGFSAGLSFKSEQYFSDFEFEQDGRKFSYAMNYPMIVSAGVAFDPMERLTLVADARYIDFENTDGFQEAGFDQTGAVTGFGWKSIYAVAVGAEYALMPNLPIRLGYAYNENPVGDDVAFYNVASPALVQHHISGGFSFETHNGMTVSAALQYAPPVKVSSPLQSPMMIPMTGSSEVPGSFMSSELSTLTAVIGLGIHF